MLKEGKLCKRFQMTLTLDQECQVRDSNISKSIGMFSIINLHFKCLECKYISYYWHLLFVSGLGQCYNTTFAFNMVLGPAPVLMR